MTSFNVGPAALYPVVRAAMAEAYDSGILSLSHRSAAFSDLYRRAEAALRAKLDVPEAYRLYLLSSATECWTVLADGLVPPGGRSIHLTSGSFGARWAQYTRNVHPGAVEVAFPPQEVPTPLVPRLGGYDLVCLTHNETSNGSQLPDGFLAAVRAAHPQALLAVDATSSLAGVALPLGEADIWFASVQKCFGLPAGLALMLVAPRAVDAIARINFDKRYNALTNIHRNALNYQTVCTPNVLGVYLLEAVLQHVPNIRETDARIRRQAADWYGLLGSAPGWQLLVPEPAVQSITVIAVQGVPERVAALRAEAQAAGFVLGSGYGHWKAESFRIANFPAIAPEAVAKLRGWLASALQSN